MKKGSFKWMKSLNRTIILNKIRTDGPISRATIAKQTKLTPPTVSSLVNELIASGLVIESEQGESVGGRKPTLLVIDQTHYHIIGLDVGTIMIRAVLVDLSGAIIEKVEAPIPLSISKDSLLKLIENTINELAHQHQEKELIGIGIGMHGVVDVASGISVYAPGLNLHEIPLKDELERRFDLHVKVDNDVRAMAFGEYWFSNGKNHDNMAVLNIGRGVGAGIILNGKLFHGEHDLAGEIGHMTIDIHGKQCSCGNHGCWETLISGPAIGVEAEQQIIQGRDSIIRSLVTNNDEKLDGKLVYEAALMKDPLALEILEKTGVYIGIGLTNLIHILNPTKIIIGGGVAQAEPFILPMIKETIANKALTEQAKDTEIFCSKQGIFATANGAAALVLGEIFEGEFSLENE
ncbi:ROK family transcriptional regulator [Lederbergia galactosidilytica]|uniref:ROK family transcriptional regulator n=1 Tax=Lederbergia galactosidilytica TaxID=217031 RepID=A0A177ZVA0_9BACI|nr:ROK family transcriptional regulator [Lederbergia galactosidilytica]OAK71419.1 ROK family transcriptional regulator [Lederbergia galactosidilytica]